jgi:hypothetical protein
VRKYFRLSAIALLSTALTVLPAHALSLNLGGEGPLVDLGNDNNADATVNLDTGGLLDDGGTGGADTGAGIDIDLGSIGDTDGGLLDGNGLLDLGGDDDDGGALIDLDGDLLDLGNDGDVLDLGGTGGLLDLGKEGDIVDFASLDFADGPLLDLSGDPASDAFVELDLGGTDLLDLGSTGGIGDVGGLPALGSGNDLLDLGGSGNLLDLGDGGGLGLDGGTTDLLAFDLGGSNIDADLNLNNDDPIVDVTITNDGNGVAGTGLLPEGSAGAGNAALLTITSGGDDDDGTGGGGGDNGNGNGGGNGNGNGNGAGGNGNGAGGNGNGAGGDGAGAGGASTNVAVATECMTLDTAELDELVKRHTYNWATFTSWASARSLKIVEVDLCDPEISQVAAVVGASANVAELQAFLASQAKVRAGLQSKGYAPGDVIAADHSGEVLTVYVI